MTDQPAGKSLCHFIFIGKIIGNAHYDVGEHDADQRDHDNILELDTLDEPDKDPCTQNGTNEGKGSTSPQGRTRCKQQSQQNAKLRRRDRCACGGRNKLVHAELLHDKPRHAHADACAEDGKQTRQAGDQKDLPCFHTACKQVGRPDIQHPDKQRTNRKNHQQNAEKNSGTMITNEKPSSRLAQTNFLKIKRERLRVKKLVLRVHTQRVLLKGLYHMASMGFKWQTLTKVLHNKPSFFVDSYKVAPNKKSLCICW